MEDKIWLVKSSYRVLGPYNRGEIFELLKSKKISILDEVRSPETRWSSVREKPEFLDIVKQLKNQDQFGDVTMTQSMAMTKSILTKTDHIPFKEEMTPTPYLPSLSSDHIQDAAVVSESRRVTAATENGESVYGSLSDQGVRQKIQKDSANFKFMLIGLLVAVAIGYIGFELMRGGIESKEYGKKISEALQLKDQKLFEKSWSAYERAVQIKQPTESEQIKMSLVGMAYRHHGVEQKKLLESVINRPGSDPLLVKEAMFARALSYMYEEDFKRASFEIDKILGIDINDVSAKVNKAVVSYFDKKYQNAFQLFSEIDGKQGYERVAILGKSMAALELSKGTVANAKLVAFQLKNSALSQKYLLRPLMLSQAYLAYLGADYHKMDESVSVYLSEPIDLSRRFAHPLEVYWGMFKFTELQGPCREMVGFGARKPLYLALNVQCLFEYGEEQRAQAELKDYLQMYPQDVYLKLTQAQLLLIRGLTAGAEAILKEIPKDFRLKNILEMEVCLKKNNLKCLERYANLFTSVRNQSPFESYYVAAYFNRIENKSKAYEIAERALELENNFIPLLEMRNQLELR